VPYPYTTERLEQDGLCSTSERARPQRRELATNLGEFSFDLESRPSLTGIRASCSVEVQMFAFRALLASSTKNKHPWWRSIGEKRAA
jgi:hypothetical protein